MKKWQIATLAAGIAVASVGAAAASITKQQAAPGTVVIVPSTIVPAAPSGDAAPRRPAPSLAPALPAPTGSVLFSADFATQDSAAWQSPLLRNVDRQPLWLMHDGVLQMAGDVALDTPADESVYLTGQSAWANLVLEADLLATSGEGAGLVWNVSGDSYYRVQLLPALPNSAPKALLERVQNGRVTVLAKAAPGAYAGYSPEAWQQLRVQSAAGRQQVWVNGAPLFDVADATLTAGQVGLYAWADSGTRFDNVRVQSAAPAR